MGTLYIASGAAQTYRRNSVSAGTGVTVSLDSPFNGASEYNIIVSTYNDEGYFEPTYKITGKSGTQFTFIPETDLDVVEFTIMPVTNIV